VWCDLVWVRGDLDGPSFPLYNGQKQEEEETLKLHSHAQQSRKENRKWKETMERFIRFFDIRKKGLMWPEWLSWLLLHMARTARFRRRFVAVDYAP
jgi:hypothetical protein